MKFGNDFDIFHIVVIIQMDIEWSNYLICVKFHPIESRVFCCPKTYDLLIQTDSMLHYKSVGNIYLVVVFILIVLLFALKKNYGLL
jgi:hypothetical protein